MPGRSIAATLGILAVIAVLLGALRDSSVASAEAVTLTVGFGFLLIFGLMLVRREASAGWLAFAVVGGAYYVYAWPMKINPRYTPYLTEGIEQIAGRFDAVANPEPPVRYEFPGKAEFIKLPESERERLLTVMTMDNERDRAYRNALPVRRQASRRIAHAILALLFGSMAAIPVSMVRSITRKPPAGAERCQP